MATVRPFSDEQARILINIAQHYEVWMEAEQALAGLPYGMNWKTVSGRDYLYEVLDRANNGKSLGTRSPTTEQRFQAYSSQKTMWKERRDASRATLDESCGIYRSVNLPLMEAQAAKILREADRRRLLGTRLLVVGTNCMGAYCIEAGGFIGGSPMETNDFDMTLAGGEQSSGTPVWSMLKAVDSTYTVNTERPFQARNAKAHEFDLLAAPSQLPAKGFADSPSPVPLPEQEWLLLGRPVNRVMVARDASPCRIVAPDPRWFALQKLWMARQEKRNHLKRPKDEKQGLALLNAICETMPHYRLDEEFEGSLPPELATIFRDWKSSETPSNTGRNW